MNENVDFDYLSLSEYSNEYGVSVSTLRRKIKAGKIHFKLIHGKYYLQRESQKPQLSAFMPVPSSKNYRFQNPLSKRDDSVDTISLMNELRRVYEQNLQSKNQQIIQLKQQIADIKTLVMYLEGENKRKLQKRDSSIHF